MWKKHPLTRFAFGLILTIECCVGLLAAGFLGADYWADAKLQPVTVQGQINFSTRMRARFELSDTTSGLVYPDIEFDDRVYTRLQNGQTVTATFSPLKRHLYTITFENGRILTPSRYEPGAFIQPYQYGTFWMLVLVGIVGTAGAAYGLAGLTDWLRSPKRIRGPVFSRIEQADGPPSEFGMLVKPWPGTGRPRRFTLRPPDFFSADGADFVEISYTPIFRYVRGIKALGLEDFPVGAVTPVERKLHYRPGWQLVWPLLTDGTLTLLTLAGLVGLPLLILPNILNGTASLAFERYSWLMVALVVLGLGLMCSYNFWSKLRDLRAPKRLTTGPVLSKWRVNGTTNEARRQIVVADGGLDAGANGVRKFDISGNLFEQIKVGDIVEIEHTPKMRYILRLDVTGHEDVKRIASSEL